MLDGIDWVGALQQASPEIRLLRKDDANFLKLTTTINGACVSPAKALALPTSAEQVSALVIFARANDVSLSIRGGGYNTAGWSIHGDLIIDLGLLSSISVHTPNDDGDVVVPPLSEGEPPSKMDTGERGRKRGEKEASLTPPDQDGGGREIKLAHLPWLRDGQTQSFTRSNSSGSDASSVAAVARPASCRPASNQTGSGSSSSSRLARPNGAVGDPVDTLEDAGEADDTPPTEIGEDDQPSQVRGTNAKGKARAIEGTRSWVEDQSTLPYDPPAYFTPTGAPSFASSIHILANPNGLTPDPQEQPPLSRSPAPYVSPGMSNSPLPSHTGNRRDPFSCNGHSSGSHSSSGTTPPPHSYPHALVTIGAGAKSRDIDSTTAPFSYYVPLAAYPVGCAVFASGGFGFLSRLHGLSMDNVVEAEIVLPDGRIVYLRDQSLIAEDDREQADLWWAFRGAGLAMCIVTKVRVKAYRLGLVYSGNLIYPFNPLTTPSLIKHWRDCCKAAPRELYLNLVLTAGPNEHCHVVAIQMCYLGPRSIGEQILQSLTSWEGERCLLKDFEMRTFLTQQESVVAVLSAQEGNRWCIRADLLNGLPDDVIHDTVKQFVHMPDRSAWLFETAGGALVDAPEGSSCFPASHRAAPFQAAAIHQWSEEQDDDVWTYAARRWIDGVISPHSPGGPVPSFLERQEGVDRIRTTFGPQNWDKLVELKRKYDPDEVLKHCFWPTAGDEPLCVKDV